MLFFLDANPRVLFYGIPITDWINSIAALIAVPGAIAGFIVLFRKDNEKQKQIEKLSSIASQIEVQNEILRESNNLLSRQVDILSQSAVTIEKDVQTRDAFKKIEQEKHRLSIRPYFRYAGGMSQVSEFEVSLQNAGGLANLIRVGTSTSNVRVRGPVPFQVDKNEKYKIYGNTINGVNANISPYKIEIDFEDAEGNKYRQIGESEIEKFEFVPPEEIK